MSFYEYKCSRHGRFTLKQSMLGERVADCPDCGESAEFIIPNFSFRFATPLTIVSDNRIIHHQPDGGNTIPPVEDIARDEKKEMG